MIPVRMAVETRMVDVDTSQYWDERSLAQGHTFTCSVGWAQVLRQDRVEEIRCGPGATILFFGDPSHADGEYCHWPTTHYYDCMRMHANGDLYGEEEIAQVCAIARKSLEQRRTWERKIDVTSHHGPDYGPDHIKVALPIAEAFTRPVPRRQKREIPDA